MQPQIVPQSGKASPLGATVTDGGVNFAVYSESASEILVCLFDTKGEEVARIPLDGHQGHVRFGLIKMDGSLTYGLRADGPFNPGQGLYFDPDKLLVDPYALQIDRPFKHDPRLAMPRGDSGDTADLVPKAFVMSGLPEKIMPMDVGSGGLTYELNVKGYTRQHPGVPKPERGTVTGLAATPVMAHLKGLGVDVVELMPVAAWIDERHLPPLGLHNAWGYNPVGYFLPDPRLMPNGIADMRALTDAYRGAGLPVILDVVYNHTGESDRLGAVLSMKGLDAKTYYRHIEFDGELALVNDAGTGNTLQCDHPAVAALVLDSLKFWVERGGVSGFRFDLAPVMGKNDGVFVTEESLLEAMRDDPVLSRCYLVVEPWDASGHAYHLGDFGQPFYEWNDRYRDDVRAFWRGDSHKIGDLATRLAGSSDIFGGKGRSPHASVNMLAVHDGYTLADVVSYEHKHNEPNGEQNRDGHSHNLSWNNGVEGATADPEINAARDRDVRALLATLFVSLGTPLIQQGDEFGRTQKGMNNGYAQDNAITWVDWAHADESLSAYVRSLKVLRDAHPAIHADRFLTGDVVDGSRDVIWWHRKGHPFEEADWHHPGAGVIGMQLLRDNDEVLVWINRRHKVRRAQMPPLQTGAGRWSVEFCSAPEVPEIHKAQRDGKKFAPGKKLLNLPPRSVTVLIPQR